MCSIYFPSFWTRSKGRQKQIYRYTANASLFTSDKCCVEAGLISGYSDTKFGTFDSISREQMASIIMRGMKSKYGNKLSITGSAMQFKDMGRINSWAKQSVNEISALGIMKGSTDGSFNPQGKVTFNEVAVILNNLDTYMQQH